MSVINHCPSSKEGGYTIAKFIAKVMQGEALPEFVLDFNIEDIYLLYECVCWRLETWQGYPARPPMEQEHLNYLKTELYKAVLQSKFSSDG